MTTTLTLPTVRTLWKSDAPLTALGLGMTVLLAFTAVALVLDPREIAGAPAWLKPAKFAASIAIYALTLAWVFTFIPEWTRTRRTVSTTTVATLALEIVIIDLQAWRGTTSHFNISTPLDGLLFAAMGLAILVQTAAAVAVAVALWRQRFSADPALGWALRLGMTITIVGALLGGLMTRPTAAQLEAARAGRGIPVAGAHTVGAPDGGPGLAGTGWSLEHGDLRVAHFLGLHALQLVPLVALALARRARHDAGRVRIVWSVAASYLSLVGLLLWQALRGQSVVNPDATTVAALGVWAVVTAGALWRLQARSEPAGVHAAVY